jgi:cellulose synthase/poly-beta-1,6-N-acetylglucosamine synthase-like glycosyltransferase
MTWPVQVLLFAVVLLVYTWVGYPVLLCMCRFYLHNLSARPEPKTVHVTPRFSIIVAVHNEEARIEQKLENCLALAYPPGAVEIVVASDGSTDATDSIVERWEAHNACIRLLQTHDRAGKSGAQNLAVAQARGELLLFTDAETTLQPDLLNRIAENFSDPEVGLVAPVVQFGKFDGAVSQGQGAYWRFEILLRQLESDTGILATASGSALAIRRNLFRPIPPQFGDDCTIPLDIRLQGFKVIQDAQAIVFDQMPHDIAGELRTRVRMTARNWNGILSRSGLLNPFRFPGTAWGLVSHKFLRWLTPFFLAAAFLSNGLLFRQPPWIWIWMLQVCFYAAALAGWKISRSGRRQPLFGYPFAFCLANAGFFLGVVRGLRGERIVAYK